MHALITALLLSQASTAVTVGVGESVKAPVVASAMTVCDDVSIISVIDKGDHLELFGLKPGTTLCSFTRRPKDVATQVRVTVVQR